MRELSFPGKRESENSDFVENENPRILVSWKTRIREFSFRGKREFFFFFFFYLFFFFFCGKPEPEQKPEQPEQN